MNFSTNIVMNIIIGLVAIVGFFWYYGKCNGWFKEGGLVYEWFKTKFKKNNKTDNSSKDE